MNVKLTEKQQRFCDFYIKNPNATDAAIKAGYSESSAKVIGCENLTKPNIKQYIEFKNKQLESIRIADMKEVKEFWTTSMRSDEHDLKDRLKASELIAKTNGAFIDKVEHSGSINLDQRTKEIEEKLFGSNG